MSDTIAAAIAELERRAGRIRACIAELEQLGPGIVVSTKTAKPVRVKRAGPPPCAGCGDSIRRATGRAGADGLLKPHVASCGLPCAGGSTRTVKDKAMIHGLSKCPKCSYK